MDPPIPAAPEQGACINCGFLCRRDIVNTHLGLFRELTDEDWRVGRFFTLFGYPLVPWCFRQAPIHQEIAEGAGSPVETSPLTANGADLVDKQNAAAAAVTRKDRRCLLWMLYQPCLGPEAHLSGQAMRDMELRQAQRAEHLEADRRKFELQLDQRRSEAEERNQRTERRIAFVGLLLAAMQVATASEDAILIRGVKAARHFITSRLG